MKELVSTDFPWVMRLGSGRTGGEYGWGGAASTHYWISPKDVCGATRAGNAIFF